MTPTLCGRLQTRVVLLAVIGIPWSLLLAQLWPGALDAGGAVASVGVIAALGLGWELVYHACQQLRWDKDWPSIFALAAVVPEAALAWPVLTTLGVAPASTTAYAVHVGSTWLAVWLATQGPIRVLAPRWRYEGARILTARLRPAAPAEPAAPAREREDAVELTVAAEPGKHSAAAQVLAIRTRSDLGRSA